MKKLVVFDVDGVLIDTEIGSFKELGVMLGKEAEIKKHHEEYERRKHLGPWGLDELALIFKGVEIKKLEELSETLISERLMFGLKETIEELKKSDYIIVSYSSSPIFIMETLKERFGFADVCGNVLEVRDGKLTGKILEKVDRYVKAERLKKFMEKNRINRENAYVIGDSVSDLPMAQYGRFIAFNSKDEKVRQGAEHVIDKKDLREILKYLR